MIPRGRPPEGAMQRRAEDRKKERRSRSEFADIPDGKSRWRVLPPWDEKALAKNRWYVRRWRHFIREGLMCRCLRTLDGQDDGCPVCRVLEEFRNQGVDVSRMEAYWKALVNALHRSKERGDQLCILEVPAGFIFTVEDAIYDDEDPLYVLDLNKGRDLKVEAAGSKRKRKYKYQLASVDSPAFRGGMEEPDLPALTRFAKVTDDHIAEAKKVAKRLRRMLESRMAGGAEETPRQRRERRESSDDAEDDQAPRRTPKPDVGRPDCYGDWLQRNDADQEDATDAECARCPHEVSCRFTAAKAQKAASGS
jgi:hypothetical protein